MRLVEKMRGDDLTVFHAPGLESPRATPGQGASASRARMSRALGSRACSCRACCLVWAALEQQQSKERLAQGRRSRLAARCAQSALLGG